VAFSQSILGTGSSRSLPIIGGCNNVIWKQIAPKDNTILVVIIIVCVVFQTIHPL
jgi:hypothetical protein